MLQTAAVHGQASRGQRSAFRPSSGLSSIMQEDEDGELTWNHQEEKRSIFVLTLWRIKWNQTMQEGEKGKVKKSWAENGAAEEDLHPNLRLVAARRMKSDEMFNAAEQRKQLRASSFAPAANSRTEKVRLETQQNRKSAASVALQQEVQTWESEFTTFSPHIMSDVWTPEVTVTELFSVFKQRVEHLTVQTEPLCQNPNQPVYSWLALEICQHFQRSLIEKHKSESRCGDLRRIMTSFRAKTDVFISRWPSRCVGLKIWKPGNER